MLAVVLAATTTTAHASPDELVTRPLVLPEHALAASLTLEIGLARLVPGNPIALAPSASFGVTARLTLGMIHGNVSVDRIAAGAGVCVRGDRCEHPYTGGGAEALYSVTTGALAVAAHARFLVRDVHPGKPAITIGPLLRYQRGRFAITSDPYLRLGLANRDRGNRTALVVPIYFGVQPSRRTLLQLHTGYDSDLAVAGDGYHIPLALALTVATRPHLDLSIEVGFASLLGPQTDDKSGAILLSGSWTVTGASARPGSRPGS